jgi:hypothetical protein
MARLFKWIGGDAQDVLDAQIDPTVLVDHRICIGVFEFPPDTSPARPANLARTTGLGSASAGGVPRTCSGAA